MKRAVLLMGVVLILLGASGAVQAQAGDSTATNNSTVQDLRERVDELENENAELKTEVTAKNGRIQELEFQLEQSQESDEFSGTAASQLKKIGAWNPYDDQPAFLIWVESADGGLYQFVGPNNGEHSFNGMNAWTRVLGGDAQLLGNITVNLKYAPEGINETLVYRSTNALPKIRQLADSMNRPRTRLAWEQWNNNERNSAETQEGRTMGFVGFAMISLFGLGLFIESRKNIVAERSAWKFGRIQSSALDRQRYSRWDDTPVIGWIIRKYRRWRNR